MRAGHCADDRYKGAGAQEGHDDRAPKASRGFNEHSGHESAYQRPRPALTRHRRRRFRSRFHASFCYG